MDQKLIQGLYDSDFADEVPNPIAATEQTQNRSEIQTELQLIDVDSEESAMPSPLNGVVGQSLDFRQEPRSFNDWGKIPVSGKKKRNQVGSIDL